MVRVSFWVAVAATAAGLVVFLVLFGSAMYCSGTYYTSGSASCQTNRTALHAGFITFILGAILLVVAIVAGVRRDAETRSSEKSEGAEKSEAAEESQVDAARQAVARQSSPDRGHPYSPTNLPSTKT